MSQMPDLTALRERYSPKPVPKCHICGAEMTVQRMSASRITYGCAGATYDDTGCHYAEGRSIADDHYEQSRVTVVDVSDPDVLVLLDALEAADKRIEEEICRANREHHRGFMMACNHLKEHENVHYADAAEMEIAALRQRIAELERYRAAFTEQNDKTEWVQHDKRFAVVRPLGKHRADVLREYIEHLEGRLKTADKLQDSAFRHGLQHGFSYGQTNDQAGYEQCLNSYSSRGKDNG